MPPFGPNAYAAANITLASYDGTACIGVNMDTAAIPDPDVFMACLRDGLDEIRAVGAPPPAEAKAAPRKSQARAPKP